jgi:DNA modification methylase
MVTEPPWGIGYDPSSQSHRSIDDDRADWRQAYALFPGDTAYAWCGALHSDVVSAGLAACGFRLRAQIVWIKQHFTPSSAHYCPKHEVCWYAVREGKTSHWQGDRKQTTVWDIAENSALGNRGRQEGSKSPTGKPIECMRRPIINSTRPGEAIYDPFLGSGTSVIAAEMTGRVCYGIELNPDFVDVAVRRWQQFTGRAARHQACGQSFDEHAARQNPTKSGGSHGETSLCGE